MTDNELLLAMSEMMDTKLKAELQPMKEDLRSVKDEVQVVKNELQIVKDEVRTVKDEIQQVKLYQENVIVPRLNTIESCYTDTYDRYKRDADRMEAAFDDIDILKKVVAEHSEKLQELAYT